MAGRPATPATLAETLRERATRPAPLMPETEERGWDAFFAERDRARREAGLYHMADFDPPPSTDRRYTR